MKYRVMPIAGRELEISYRVKCVAVESERVFGDIVVTRQTSAADLTTDQGSCPKRRNLVQQYLDGPDFLELNRRKDSTAAKWQKAVVLQTSVYDEFDRCHPEKIERSKSLEPSPTAFDIHGEDSFETNSVYSDGGRRRRVIFFVYL